MEVAPFTDREKEILEHLSMGLNSKEISSQLNISSHTVDAHRKNMMQKLNARNVAHLVRLSLEKNLF